MSLLVRQRERVVIQSPVDVRSELRVVVVREAVVELLEEGVALQRREGEGACT